MKYIFLTITLLVSQISISNENRFKALFKEANNAFSIVKSEEIKKLENSINPKLIELQNQVVILQRLNSPAKK